MTDSWTAGFENFRPEFVRWLSSGSSRHDIMYKWLKKLIYIDTTQPISRSSVIKKSFGSGFPSRHHSPRVVCSQQNDRVQCSVHLRSCFWNILQLLKKQLLGLPTDSLVCTHWSRQLNNYNLILLTNLSFNFRILRTTLMIVLLSTWPTLKPCDIRG